MPRYDPKATTPPVSRVLGPQRQLPTGTLVLLDLDVEDMSMCVDAVLHELQQVYSFEPEYLEEMYHLLQGHAERGPDMVHNAVAVVHETLVLDGPTITVLARLSNPLELEDHGGHHTRFVWVLASDHETHPHVSCAVEFANLMEGKAFRASVTNATTVDELNIAYGTALDEELHFEHHIPAELRETGRLFGGLQNDIARRLPHYRSDFLDGLVPKALASTLFLFFAVLAPSVAFGGLLSVLTSGEIGVVETLIGTSLGGIFYALVSGQPLTIIGSTGPIVIFLGLLYPLSVTLGVPYLPSLAWVGFWTMIYLLIIAATDRASWIRFFTRFTDDIFAALISAIFVFEALNDLVKLFVDKAVPRETALLSLILALGTYLIATQLSHFRRSPYLRRWVREFLADFGPAIAIFAMTGVALSFSDIALDSLAVPDVIRPTLERGWLVNPFDAPRWVMFGSMLPAILGTILVYLDQNITVRLVNNPDYKLKKGPGYHLDLTVVAVMIGFFSLFGLPWLVAATVRSINHVRSLADVSTDSYGQERIDGVLETRVTGVAVHVLLGLSLLLLPVLRLIPMSVLFGLFLFMGIASMRGNQFFERLRLWFMEPKYYPPTYYLRAVPTRVVHKYTAVQAVALAVLWLVKTSSVAILFPLVIAMLVPVRMLLERFFEREHLALLDAEEAPDEEDMQMLD